MEAASSFFGARQHTWESYSRQQQIHWCPSVYRPLKARGILAEKWHQSWHPITSEVRSAHLLPQHLRIQSYPLHAIPEGFLQVPLMPTNMHRTTCRRSACRSLPSRRTVFRVATHRWVVIDELIYINRSFHQQLHGVGCLMHFFGFKGCP